MKRSSHSFIDKALGARFTAVALAACLALPALAAAQERTAFKVCADPNYLPYSNKAREGFENKLAEMLAADLGLPTTYTWFPQRMGFIRNTLRSRGVDGEYKCDVVMGLPTGYELAITTKPYYRSTYALVYAKGRGLDDVGSPEDLLKLEPARRDKLRFGLAERNPGNLWLAKHGLLDQLVMAYASQLGDPAKGPGALEVRDLLAGNIDATIMWGPIAGYFARSTEDPELVALPMRSEPDLKLDFAISVGVRFGQGERKKELQELLDKNADRIAALLESYGVPLVDERGKSP